jgi:hypothetical protein
LPTSKRHADNSLMLLEAEEEPHAVESVDLAGLE